MASTDSTPSRTIDQVHGEQTSSLNSSMTDAASEIDEQWLRTRNLFETAKERLQSWEQDYSKAVRMRDAVIILERDTFSVDLVNAMYGEIEETLAPLLERAGHAREEDHEPSATARDASSQTKQTIEDMVQDQEQEIQAVAAQAEDAIWDMERNYLAHQDSVEHEISETQETIQTMNTRLEEMNTRLEDSHVDEISSIERTMPHYHADQFYEAQAEEIIWRLQEEQVAYKDRAHRQLHHLQQENKAVSAHLHQAKEELRAERGQADALVYEATQAAFTANEQAVPPKSIARETKREDREGHKDVYTIARYGKRVANSSEDLAG